VDAKRKKYEKDTVRQGIFTGQRKWSEPLEEYMRARMFSALWPPLKPSLSSVSFSRPTVSFNIRDGQSTITGDFSQLEKLIKGLKEPHGVDIGVFKDAKTPDGQSVAEYGAHNEFGSVSIPDHPPKRSFIRMPLEAKQGDIAKYAESHAKEHLEAGNVKAIFEDIGIAGQAKIQEAFDTQGFGTWRPDAESTVDRKGSSAPLIDDGTLRKAVTYEVDRK